MNKLSERLRLMQVKRWPVNWTGRDQSVAEHSYGVLLITISLVESMSAMDRARYSGDCLLYAIFHDMNEIYTGDIPSSFKRQLRANYPGIKTEFDDQTDVSEEVKAIVKLADCLEAIYYLREFGTSRFGEAVLEDILANLDREMQDSKAPEPVVQKAQEILQWI